MVGDDATPSAAAPPSPPSPSRPGAGRLLAIGLPILLVLVAGSLRFSRLDHPERIYFDETYYAEDAQAYLLRGVEADLSVDPPVPDFAVHPPVGKWSIALGIAAFGYDSFGWRAGAAAAGTLTVLMVYLIGLRLFRRRGIAALAALLVTVDGLAFTMSRIAMLDVFLMLFVTIGFWLLLIDRDRQWAGVEELAAGRDLPEDGEASLPARPHPYRYLAGVAFGLALGTKWSALTAIGAAGLFVLVSELAWRRRLTGRLLHRPWPIVTSGLASLVLVPLVVYVASYAGWFANFENTRKAAPGISAVEVGSEWLDEQREIAVFHRDLDADHQYRASPLTWFLMTRPVAYYWEACDAQPAEGEEPCDVAVGNVSEIIGFGNPLIWWMALLAYPIVGWFAVARRDWRALAILAFLVLQALPWHLSTRPVFLFYMTPAVPFLCLSLAYAAWRALDERALRWVPAVVATLAVVAFLFFYPVLIGEEISRGAWDLRIWIPTWV